MDAIRNGNYKCSSVTFVKFLLFVHAFRLSLGQSDPPYVAVLRSPVATTENPTVIQVYRGTRDATVEFDKAVLRGRDLSNQTYFFRGNTPPVSVQSVINRTSEPAILILPTTLTPSQRSGIYTISVNENGGTFLWRVLVTKENATIRALEYSTVVSRGDPVTVSVEAESEIRLNWRRNGEWYTRFGNQSMPCANTLSCTDTTIFPGMFVFECHGGGAYPRQEHALMNVIVRECEHNKWGPPGCMNYCQPCINGGICSVLTGSCLCPPGFSGNHCENVHGSNVFGQTAEYRCDDSGDDHSNGCQGAMICYPNPFGCICPAGYTGLDCMETCERGKFGANCKQECHCLDNSLCASDTGVCEDGECETGWFGVNCQLTEIQVLPAYASSDVLRFSDVTSTTILVRWPPWNSMNDVGYGPIIDYRIQIRENGTEVFSETRKGTDLVHHSTGLKPYTLYEFRIILVREGQGGEGAPSNVQRQRTLCDGLPEPPTNIQHVESSPTKLEFSWDPPRCQSQNGSITNYSYQLHSQDNRTVTEGTTPFQGVIITDLIPGTEYSFVVRASISKSFSPPSDVIIARTEDIPGPPRNVIVTDRSETSLTIEWSMPVNLNGSIIHYQLQFRAIEKLYDQQFVLGAFNQSINISTQGEANVYVLKGLEPSTLYEMKLFAVTSLVRGDDVCVTERTDLYKDLQAVNMLPEVDLRGTTATLTLPALNQQYASAYYIRVQKGKSTARQNRDVDGFGNFSQNPDHYIAAEVEKNEQEMEFTLGDGETYGGYFNAPLQEETTYNAYIGIGGKAGEDVIVTWSDSIAFGPSQGSILIPILTVLLLVCLAVFVTCFVICFVVFRRYQRRKTLETGMAEYATSIWLEKTMTGQIDEGSGGTDAHSDQNPSSMYLEPSDGYIVPDQDTNYGINRSEIGDTGYDDVGIIDTPTNSLKPTKGEGDVGKQEHIVNDLSKSNVRVRGSLPATSSTSTGRRKSLDVNDCFEDPPIIHTLETKYLACKIKLKDLPKQLQGRHSDLDGTIEDEFKKLPDGQQHPWTVGKLKDKNPDSGILPYDHSRVKIDKDSKELNSDYYNASYIKVKHTQTLIAAQDPDETTTDVFWKMVWMETVDVIVNLSKALGSSFQYWPDAEGTCKVFGEYTIICNKSPVIDVDSSFREIMVVKGDKVHEVKLCQFLSWPACDIPLESLSLIDFIRSIKALKTKRSHPQLLVHCRNGVGATGVFIAFYCLLDDLKNSKKTNKSVLSVVTNMRKDRINMVENETQYWFLYQCLAVALLSPKITLREDDVMKMDLTKQKDEVAQEFKTLQICRSYSVQHRCAAGKQQENTDKNRYATILPCDLVRAVLRTPGAFRGYTDYINASVVNSFYATEVFIMAQSPLPNTVEDFWRMVIDYDCASIVCLNEMDQNDETLGMYWSEHGQVQHGNMLVKCINTSPIEGGISQCKLSVISKKEKKMITLDHYMVTGWSLDLSQIAEIVGLVGKIRARKENNRPVVVHCMDGASRCGVFVTVLLDISRHKKKKPGSLFDTVLKLSGCNSHVIRSLDEYYLCHQLLQTFLQDDENYYHQVE